MVTDGADADVLAALQQQLQREGAQMILVAPQVGGVTASDGVWVEADEKLDGGPSVVFDAVVLLPSSDGAKLLASEATARDFVADAFAHLKFIAYDEAAQPLLDKAGIANDLDEGCVTLKTAADVAGFVQKCRQLRWWEREPKVKRI
ncbi:hypothetical protein [Alkalilimnicola ehrlichii]|uniref:hypothetical protein n=1 Tax=Alkalilimnicola ehrlichii TaxID=351052 RepID=UPI002868EEC1|nr:hypothetical protein [Alkalilimnicola ehrlichii]